MQARQAYENEKLVEQRRRRGELRFLDRMKADALNKEAFSEVCALRQHPSNRMALDRAIDRLRPVSREQGPVIVKHCHKLLYEGQDKKMDWAPLEYY